MCFFFIQIQVYMQSVQHSRVLGFHRVDRKSRRVSSLIAEKEYCLRICGYACWLFFKYLSTVSQTIVISPHNTSHNGLHIILLYSCFNFKFNFNEQGLTSRESQECEVTAHVAVGGCERGAAAVGELSSWPHHRVLTLRTQIIIIINNYYTCISM